MACQDETERELVDWLKAMFAEGNSSDDSCSTLNSTSLDFFPAQAFEDWVEGSYGHGKDFSAYTIPFIIAIGLTGNIISLRVFTSTRLCKLSASLYLTALSASDTLVLLTYVLFNWLLYGLPRWPAGHRIDILNINGVCHSFLFISYTFRFISVYLIIIFTIERYIAVCWPLHRRRICTKNFAKKFIIGVHIAGGLISIYKPILSGIYPASSSPQGGILSAGEMMQFYNNNTNNHLLSNHALSDASDNLFNTAPSGHAKICTGNPDYKQLNFIMDLLYGLSITAVPFVLVTVFNFLMLRKLINRHILSGRIRAVFKESKMRIEFTVTVIAVSTCFVCLNIPYFVIWVQQFLQTVDPDDPDVLRQNSEYHRITQSNSEYISITRTIFTLNYSINFFVYCLTGTYYRGVIRNLFRCGKNKKPGHRGGHLNSTMRSSCGVSTHSHTTEV
jgi:hypothetical protein